MHIEILFAFQEVSCEYGGPTELEIVIKIYLSTTYHIYGLDTLYLICFVIILQEKFPRACQV